MELPIRQKNDTLLPDGTFRRVVEELRQKNDAHDLRIAIFSAFDFRTRMLPYWYAATRMAPCSLRTLADSLDAAGFKHVRVVLQQWSPNVRPSTSKLDGRPIDLLLVSAMQVHAEPSYEIVRDAHRLGDDRPLIFAGGPKAIYEPTHYFNIDGVPGLGADCVVTGEAFVLMALLLHVLQNRGSGESVRAAFERVRGDRSLNEIPGLVYMHPDAAPTEPLAINTGVQRLLRDLDELPMPDAGYRLLEPPHRGTSMRERPLDASRVRRNSPISSVIGTHGCKFNCSYCPIPAVNQRTWRHKSPERFAAEIAHIHEQFGMRHFFGTDDNFFNDRGSVLELMSEMERTTVGGKRLAKCMKFYTEGTQFDVHKNLDILPLCRRGGLRGIWFGIEDLTAGLVNKGQTVDKTAELFEQMRQIGIQPMAMMIHNDSQPVRSPRGDLSGLINQAKYLFKTGAVSYQCTYLTPTIGTRDYDDAMDSGIMYRQVGNRGIPQAFLDGNHVVASTHERPWQRQIELMRGYAAFYNPINMLRTIPMFLRKDSVSAKRFFYQIIGQIGLLMTIPKLGAWAWRLRKGPIERWNGTSPDNIRMIDASTNAAVDWAAKQKPSPVVAMATARCAGSGSCSDSSSESQSHGIGELRSAG